MALTSKPILTLTVQAGETLVKGDPVGPDGTKAGTFIGVCQEAEVLTGQLTAIACKGALIGKAGAVIAAGDEVVATATGFVAYAEDINGVPNGRTIGVALTAAAAGGLFEFVA